MVLLVSKKASLEGRIEESFLLNGKVSQKNYILLRESRRLKLQRSSF